jgi:hypothetical protein
LRGVGGWIGRVLCTRRMVTSKINEEEEGLREFFLEIFVL